MNKRNQWKINIVDALFIKNTILIGVGWWQYQSKPNFYTKLLLKRVLHTTCPTTWMLTSNHCKKIAIHKADNIVVTITDYMRDKKMIEILQKNHQRVFLWIQGSMDFEYYKSLKWKEEFTKKVQ